MTSALHDALDRAAELAPDGDLDAAALWDEGRRANRIARAALAAAVVAAIVVGGLTAWFAIDRDEDLPPTGQHGSSTVPRFPSDLYDVPGRVPIESAPGPMSFVAMGTHDGFWPWSDSATMPYGVTADGSYVFIDLPNELGTGHNLDGKPVMSLSPDGSKLAFPAVTGPRAGESLGILNLVTGAESDIDVGDPDGMRLTWITWSPDGSQIAVGRAQKSLDAPHAFMSDDAYVVDTETLRGYELRGSYPLVFEAVSWKPDGGAVGGPGGISGQLDHNLVVLDPTTGDQAARYTLPQAMTFQRAPIWNATGTAFVVHDLPCTNRCGNDDQVTVGTVPVPPKSLPPGFVTTGSVETATLGNLRAGDFFEPLGWTQAGDVVGYSAYNGTSTSLIVASLDGSTLTSNVSAHEVPATGIRVAAESLRDFGGDAPSPRPPLGVFGWLVLIAYGAAAVALIGRAAGRHVRGWSVGAALRQIRADQVAATDLMLTIGLGWLVFRSIHSNPRDDFVELIEVLVGTAVLWAWARAIRRGSKVALTAATAVIGFPTLVMTALFWLSPLTLIPLAVSGWLFVWLATSPGLGGWRPGGSPPAQPVLPPARWGGVVNYYDGSGSGGSPGPG